MKTRTKSLVRYDEKLEQRLAQFQSALEHRRLLEDQWQDCYDYVLPYRNAFQPPGGSERKYDHIFDGTAADAVDQLAASLLAELTPPWSRWFGFKPGPDMTDAQRDQYAPLLDQVQTRLQSHFDRSNFAVEMHQAYLDLVTVGTGTLAFEETLPGDLSAFRFTAVPLADLVLREGADGKLNTTYRQLKLTPDQMAARYAGIDLPDDIRRAAEKQSNALQDILEYVVPSGNAYEYGAIWNGGNPVLLFEKRVASSPFLHFRWIKSPGETYGRSPVMKALPDIKTANRVVELILKNASIAVTGIWQADDDGVMNPANIKLVPGAIIPKAVGSAGLTPLGAPGKFDVSQLVLTDLRNNIQRALLVNQLGAPASAKMTATEVMQRAADAARILGATYGRLQSELLTPLIMRGLSILQRRGEIPPLQVDGRFVELHYSSPLAQAQTQRDGQNILTWVSGVESLGPAGKAMLNLPAIVQYFADMYGVPPGLMQNSDSPLSQRLLPDEWSGTAGEGEGPAKPGVRGS
jgi:hypothetical protein